MIPSSSPAGRHHFLLCEWRDDSLRVDIIQPGERAPAGSRYREDIGALDLDSLSRVICEGRRDPREYRSERFAMIYSVPGDVIRLDAREMGNRYIARFMFPDRVSSIGITAARYGEGARAGLMEDVEVFRVEYGKKGYILSTDAEGAIAGGPSADGYWWTGSTDGGKRIKCAYYAKDDVIYCLIYSSTDDLYAEHIDAFEAVCASLVLHERHPSR
jgi:hypothetical protein